MLACAPSRGGFPRTTSAARSALPTSHLVVFDVLHDRVDSTTLRARIRSPLVSGPQPHLANGEPAHCQAISCKTAEFIYAKVDGYPRISGNQLTPRRRQVSRVGLDSGQCETRTELTPPEHRRRECLLHFQKQSRVREVQNAKAFGL